MNEGLRSQPREAIKEAFSRWHRGEHDDVVLIEQDAMAALAACAGDADFVRALDLHKERIRRLQEALCECQQRDLFQADFHDDLCPVYVIAEAQKREYEPRV